MIRDLIEKNRSYRRFEQEISIERQILEELVDLARLSASAANLQPLKYMLSCDSDKNSLIFPLLGWAGYLKDWDGPCDGERPSAYIIILGDKHISKSFDYDCGIAAQSILLGATEKGLGGCMIATIQKDKLREALSISPDYEILLVIGIGEPKETVLIDETGPAGDIKYWRDEQDRHHVPKRPLDEVIIN
jgi:nitroreductase